MTTLCAHLPALPRPGGGAGGGDAHHVVGSRGRYGEKLATPDTSIADLIGRWIRSGWPRAVTSRMSWSSITGWCPAPTGASSPSRAARPRERIQVGLLNIIGSGTSNPRFRIRLPLDVLVSPPPTPRTTPTVAASSPAQGPLRRRCAPLPTAPSRRDRHRRAGAGGLRRQPVPVQRAPAHEGDRGRDHPPWPGGIPRSTAERGLGPGHHRHYESLAAALCDVPSSPGEGGVARVATLARSPHPLRQG